MKHNLGLTTAGLVTLAASAAFACSDAATSPRPLLADRDATALQLVITDVRSRVMPTLGRDDATASLSQSLGAITSALNERDPAALRIAIEQVDAALTQLAARGAESAPVADAELEVVRLALDDARSMIAPH